MSQSLRSPNRDRFSTTFLTLIAIVRSRLDAFERSDSPYGTNARLGADCQGGRQIDEDRQSLFNLKHRRPSFFKRFDFARIRLLGTLD